MSGDEAGRNLVQLINDTVRSVVAPVLPAFETAIVTSVESNQARIQRLASPTPETPIYPVLASAYDLRVGDTVVCARFGTSLVVLGRVATSSSQIRGQTILSWPLVASTTGHTISSISSYAEPLTSGLAWARRTLPFGMPIQRLRLHLAVITAGAATKGIEIRDEASGAVLLNHEWVAGEASGNYAGFATPWVDVTTFEYTTDRKVRIFVKDSTNSAMNWYFVAIEGLVGW